MPNSMLKDPLLSLGRKMMDKNHLWDLLRIPSGIFEKDELGVEIAQIALPAALALTADPIASLIDTAFIGHIGPVELAAVGVAIAVINQTSKIAIFPLVSVTTSLIAEEEAIGNLNNDYQEVQLIEKEFVSDIEKDDSSQENVEKIAAQTKKRHLSSASTALIIGCVLGLLQAVILICGAKPILSYMGLSSNSPMLKPALKYLILRSLGAPAVLLSLAMQGIFRGFKDTKTPLYATLIGDAANVILDPIFIFVFGLGVSGAAIAHVISQYLISLILLWRLMEQVDILPPAVKDIHLSRFLKNGFLLFLRVIAATFCVTLAASLASKLGSNSMAAFQICLQVWLASSLLADGLAVAGQAILASAFARSDYEKIKATTSRVIQLGLVVGLILCLFVFLLLISSSEIFTKDPTVLSILQLGIPFVVMTQPINSLAFVFDGLNYGASDFAFSAYSMIAIAVVSILSLFFLSSSSGFVGIWVALSIFMCLRASAGFIRIWSRSGPWSFLSASTSGF